MSITFEHIANAHRAAIEHVRRVADQLAAVGFAATGDAVIAGAATLLIETAKQGALGEFAPVIEPDMPITFGTVWRGQSLSLLSVKELEWALDESTGKKRVPDHWRTVFEQELDRKRKAVATTTAVGTGG